MINIAQIGCGYWGPNLLRNLVANSNCNVHSVCDLTKGRRDYVRSLYPAIQVTGDCEKVLSSPEIDAVVIATPVFTHYDLAIKGLTMGKHILVEKPMASSIEEVEHIRDLAKEKNLVAMVGHTFLFNPAVRYLKQLIESGELGDIRYIYSQRLNLGRIRSDVDALWNLAPHDISIIQYLLDDTVPLAVKRHGMDFIQDGVEDVVFMNILYPNKVVAHVHVSWLDPQKTRRMTVVGEKKMVVYDDMSENKIAIYDKGIDRVAVLGEKMDFDHQDYFTFNHRSGDVIMPKINFQEPLKLEIEHFLECIVGKEICLTDADHALGVVGILSTNNNEWR